MENHNQAAHEITGSVLPHNEPRMPEKSQQRRSYRIGTRITVSEYGLNSNMKRTPETGKAVSFG
jgi:hypothetical protein